MQRQELEFNPAELYVEVRKLRGDVDNQNEARSKARLDFVLENAPPELKLALKAATEKGASSWVTAAPSYDHGTVLHNVEADARSDVKCCGFWTNKWSHL